MALVGYSDSEGSDDDNKSIAKPATAVKPVTTKSSFQKFKDSSNPHKIKVSLPTAAPTTTTADDEDGERAPKRAKISGSGFNAMLPAPKRTKAALASSTKGKGLGSGVNLKTGANPGFSREIQVPEPAAYDADDSATNGDYTGASLEPSTAPEPEPEPPRKTGSAMVFKPLSVSRKPKKKSAAAIMAASSTKPTAATAPPPKPKVSLFSTPVTDDLTPQAATGTYQPMIYSTGGPDEDTEDQADSAFDLPQQDTAQPTTKAPQSLADLASTMNLTPAQQRQLFGRNGNLSSARVVEFNTETEYARNEELRAKGETQQHNAVRTIQGGGKHSLQQLIGMVSSQKDALEESFAAGRRNKKEAGAKYGWS